MATHCSNPRARSHPSGVSVDEVQRFGRLFWPAEEGQSMAGKCSSDRSGEMTGVEPLVNFATYMPTLIAHRPCCPLAWL
jgi:hypothetical protein